MHADALRRDELNWGVGVRARDLTLRIVSRRMRLMAEWM